LQKYRSAGTSRHDLLTVVGLFKLLGAAVTLLPGARQYGAVTYPTANGLKSAQRGGFDYAAKTQSTRSPTWKGNYDGVVDVTHCRRPVRAGTTATSAGFIALPPGRQSEFFLRFVAPNGGRERRPTNSVGPTSGEQMADRNKAPSVF